MPQTTIFEKERPVQITVDLSQIEETDVSVSKAFVENVDALGIIEPVVLFGTDPYEIADGKRRIQAARMLDMEEVPAVWHKTLSSVAAAAIGVSGNFHRSPNPLDEAEQIGELMKRGWDEDRMASVLRWDISTVRKRIRLFGAPEAIKEGVRRGDIAVTTAERVANLSPTYQKKAVGLYEERGKLLGKDVKSIQQAKRKEAFDAMPDDLFGPVEETPPKGLGLFLMKWKNFAESAEGEVQEVVEEIIDELEEILQ